MVKTENSGVSALSLQSQGSLLIWKASDVQTRLEIVLKDSLPNESDWCARLDKAEVL